MLNTIKKRFALSTKGAKDFCKGVLMTTLFNLALMLPAVFVFLFLDDYLRPVFAPSASVLHGVIYYTVTGIAFMLLMYVIAIFQYRSTFITVYDESAARRISLAEKLRKLPLAYFSEKNLSDLTATIMDDCTDLEHTFSHAVPQLFASVAAILLITTGLFFYNWQLTLAMFWVVPLATAIILIAKKKTGRLNRIYYQSKRDVSEHIQEGLDCIREIKSCNREADYIEQLNAKIDFNEKMQTRGELFIGVMVNVSQSVLKLGMASVVIVGAGLLARSAIDLFTYLIFILVASRIYAPVEEVFNNLMALFFLDVRINRMNEMEALPVQQGTTAFEPDGFDIEFRNVTFEYEQGKPVLQNVSFIARQGEITALVGRSGSGKSTAARLAARFWDVRSGKILFGGCDVGAVDPETLLKYFSVVFQDVVLFNASIMDNIRIGRRDASDEDVLSAARLACCDEFACRMPQGYHTVIGENGETLSGGERQRVSIARALLKDAPIVLLDEATASLDVENETRIQTGISTLIRNKTVLVIAHRMRTVASADKIVVLDNGAVAESGAPKTLLAAKGIFAEMIERQRTGSKE
ncbi:MAG: ABC transporter ATP-binding protein/permease [Dysgonamonadaceae bacterium]|jgi:ATP-binding cassette subfamily B protein|nr:ABC transporter ATP-binding protein/permease [Dysgonamonadaceae bacterium]